MSKNIVPQSRTKKPRSFQPLQPLECRHYKNHSEIVASIQAGKEWSLVAETRSLADINHEVMAKYICQLMNDNLSHKNILYDAMDTLKLCLSEANMTFSTEQAADCVLKRIQRVSL
jgi:hypothetical protein